jgi:hypothetical protein
MTNLKHILSVGLAATTALAALPFFIGGALLYVQGLAPLILQAGIVPGTGPAWFVPVVPVGVLGVATAAFVVSRRQRSYLVAGLLIASGIVFMIPAIIATGYLAVIVIPGPILGIISGLGILGLGIAKSIRTARAPVTTASALNR